MLTSPSIACRIPISPAQLRRNKVAVRTVLRRILVHATKQPFLARLFAHAQLGEYRVDFGQNRSVEGVDGRQIHRSILSGVGQSRRLVLGGDSGGSGILITGSAGNVFTVFGASRCRGRCKEKGRLGEVAFHTRRRSKRRMLCRSSIRL